MTIDPNDPYWRERRLEELWHLQYMPGEAKRRDPEVLQRIAQIELELSKLPDRREDAADRSSSRA